MKTTTTTPKTKAPKTISIKGVVKSKKTTTKETTPITEQKPLTDKQISIRERRQALRDLSNELKSLAQINGKEAHVNELLREFYAGSGHTELKTFEQWKEQGFSVRKGEKALLLWGKPQTKQNEEKTEDGSEENATEFYPLAFLFSMQQVTKYNQQ